MKNIKLLKTALLVITALLFLVSFIIILIFYLLPVPLDWRSNIIHQKGDWAYRLLDGQLVPIDKTELKPVAVMLENHYESRPISGLEEASIIYEVVVEGDITRFLAIFDGSLSAKKIGPVRSVRPFFVELAEEWNSVLFHAGGSQDAMYKLTYSPVYNINEISSDGIYFWRDPVRGMPHNLYTSANLIERAIVAKEIDTKADFLPWQFKNDENQESRIKNQWNENIEIDFSGNPLYQVEYKYNPESNDYTRYLASKVHKTDRGIILKAKNIVVQYVNFDIIDDYGRLNVDVKNGGTAEIYQDGKKIEGSWVKDENKRTHFYNQEGQEVRFNRGTIWIELVFD